MVANMELLHATNMESRLMVLPFKTLLWVNSLLKSNATTLMTNGALIHYLWLLSCFVQMKFVENKDVDGYTVIGKMITLISLLVALFYKKQTFV